MTQPRAAVNTPGRTPPHVSIHGYTYRVDLGPGLRPRHHTVRKDRSCDCPLGTTCPAVSAVAGYLRRGGARAPDPTATFWFRAPDECPACGAATAADRALDSRAHGRGWRCLADPAHHWLVRAQALQAAQRRAHDASPDYAGLPGLPSQTAQERAAWLAAHPIRYAVWA